MIIKKITGYLYTIPLQQSFAYFTASLTNLPYILVAIETDNEITGIGEAALAWDVTGETQAGALACIDLIRPAIIGSSIETLAQAQALIDHIQLSIYGNTALKTGIESALLDIVGQHANLPIYKLIGGEEKRSIILQRTFSFEEIASDTLALARDAHAKGVCVFKFKVGKNSKKESETIHNIRNAYPDATIALDANQAWENVSQAQLFLETIRDENIAWVEQPLRAVDYEGLALLRTQCEIPVMADESCHTLHDLKTLQSYQAIDLVNLKLAKCGGLFELMRMISFCKTNNIRYALGDMIHSSIGTAYNLHAATLGDFVTYDLTLPSRIQQDCGEGLTFEDFKVAIPNTPGLGVHLKKETPCSLLINTTT